MLKIKTKGVFCLSNYRILYAASGVQYELTPTLNHKKVFLHLHVTISLIYITKEKYVAGCLD